MSGPESALWVREGGLPRGEVSSPQESSRELRSFRCRCAPIPEASSTLEFWNTGSRPLGGYGGGVGAGFAGPGPRNLPQNP